MSEDPYKSPESNVAVASNAVTALPNPLIVALLIIAVSVIIGAVFGVIEYFLDFTLPANSFLTTIVPAFVIGSYYGKKRQDFFPRSFRVKVIIIWLVIGVLLAGVAFTFIAPDLLSLMSGDSTFVAIFIGMVLLGCVFCYFALSFGEKIGIKSLKKNA
jgi:uncharacterized membrane protein YraQ (UPF0718 family)